MEVKMRIFEMLMIISIGITLLLELFKLEKIKIIKNYNILAGCIFFVLHYVYEGIRWQMYLVYFFIITLLLMNIYSRLKKEDKRRPLRNNIVILMTLVIIVCTSVANIVFPVSKINQPTGKYNIGTTSFFIEDTLREEVFTKDENDSRKIMIQMWYPGNIKKGDKKAPWLENGKIISNGIAKMMGYPNFIFSHLHLVKSNAFNEAEILNIDNPYPIIIISHGWTGFKNIHNDIAELLSSSGYVVVSIDHSYGSVATVFPNNEVIYLDRSILPNREGTPDFLKYANTLVNTYSNDIISTIDVLEKINEGEVDTQFENKLDFSKIGVIGHSTGGGASVKASMVDKRIKAVFGMDPWVEPLKDEYINKGLNVPAVFLRSEEWETGLNNENLFSLLDNSNNVELYSIEGTKHTDFTMAYMFSPFTSKLNITGTIDKRLNTKIQHEFILDFYNRHLKEDNSKTTLELEKQYKEVNREY